MRKLALLLALLVIPAQAWAFNTDDLLSTIAMPLAVAAVSNVAGVQDSQLADLVATLNQANVDPTQFVEVIRYVPVTLVDQNGDPFVAYVREQTSQGITGDALVNRMCDRLRSNYNVTPAMTLDTDPTAFVLSDNYIPSGYANSGYATGGYATAGYNTQFSGDSLSFIALPLAVAAVSDIMGVSQDDLGSLVATLNGANCPVNQEIEIIRYAPVALIDQNGQPFIAYIQQQTAQGITGPALVPVVVQQLQTYYPSQTQIAAAPAFTYSPAPVPQRVARYAPAPAAAEFTPPPVAMSRVEEMRGHPHGGPPGQLKKQFGAQTGAEVVHGEKRGRQFGPAPVVAAPAPVAVAPQPGPGRGKGRHEAAQAPMISSAPPAAAPAPVAAPPGKAKGHGEGGNDQGKGKGKDNGKGHGKD